MCYRLDESAIVASFWGPIFDKQAIPPFSRLDMCSGISLHLLRPILPIAYWAQRNIPMSGIMIGIASFTGGISALILPVSRIDWAF